MLPAPFSSSSSDQIVTAKPFDQITIEYGLDACVSGGRACHAGDVTGNFPRLDNPRLTAWVWRMTLLTSGLN